MLCHTHFVFTLPPLRFICLFLTPSPTLLFPIPFCIACVMLNIRHCPHHQGLLYLLVAEEQSHSGSPGERWTALRSIRPCFQKEAAVFWKGHESCWHRNRTGQADRRLFWQTHSHVTPRKENRWYVEAEQARLSKQNIPYDLKQKISLSEELYSEYFYLKRYYHASYFRLKCLWVKRLY